MNGALFLHRDIQNQNPRSMSRDQLIGLIESVDETLFRMSFEGAKREAKREAKLAECEAELAKSEEKLAEREAELAKSEEKLAEREAELVKSEEKAQWLQEQLDALKETLYGRKSEKTENPPPDQKDTSGGDEEDMPEPDEEEDPPETAEPTPRRKRRKTSQGANRLPKNVTVIEEIIGGDEPPRCPECKCKGKCKGKWKMVGTEYVRQEVVIHPARAVIRRVLQAVWKCENCDCENRDCENCDCENCDCDNEGANVLIRAKAPPAIIPGSYASIEGVSWLINEKYAKGMPLYRIETDLRNLGCPLSRSTLCNWTLLASEAHLEPVWRAMREDLLKQPVIIADETVFQVLHEKGRKASQKSYMWTYRSGDWEENPLVLIDYQPSRGSQCPEAILGSWSGSLQCDGYSAYHKFEHQVNICGCWSHCRRKWKKAVDALPPTAAGSRARKGLEFCNRIFALEARVVDLSPEERVAFRHESIKPVLDEFHAWLEPLVAGKSMLGTAINYTRQQWPYLLGFLDDGLASLTTNSVERDNRAIAVGRKNYMFGQNERGARTTAVCLSVVQTARANNLMPLAYIEWILAGSRDARPMREDVSEHVEAAIRHLPTSEPRVNGDLTETDRNLLDMALREFDTRVAHMLLPHKAPDSCRVPESESEEAGDMA